MSQDAGKNKPLVLKDGRNKAKVYKRNAAAYKDKKNSGLCVYCWINKTSGGIYCDACKAKRKKQTKRYRDGLKLMGLCLQCTKPVIPGKNFCVDCFAIKMVKWRDLVSHRKCNNLCMDCGVEGTITPGKKKLCFKCWAKGIAGRTLGNYNKWEDIKAILERQKYKCPYTGQVLIPGKNTSLDHIVPKSKGGSNDIDNLECVIKIVNTMKHNQSHEEFIKIMQDILGYLKVAS